MMPTLMAHQMAPLSAFVIRALPSQTPCILSVFCCLSAHERAMTLSETEATQQVRDWGFTTAFTWIDVPYVYPTPRHPWLLRLT